jgi:serine/threonine protein kinase
MTDMPKFLGPYQIESILGKGAMGTVYKAHDPNIDRTVAIKTIHQNLLDEDDNNFLSYFKREAQAAGRLNHPNIVAIYGFGEQGSTPYLVMEYAPGQTLAQKLKNGKVGVEESLSIVLQILHALEHAHTHKVVHRDIKPANIILDNGIAKVMDFGIAKIETTDLTMMGDVKGTPGYMSPEQWQGKTVDHRSDLFSTGVILYQLLTGDKPFNGDTQANVLHRTLNTNPAAPSKLNPEVLLAFDGVVEKAIAKDPGKRFQSAKEFLATLSLAKKNWLALLDDKTVIQPHPAGKGQHKPKRNKAVAFGILAVMAAIAGGVSLWKLTALQTSAAQQKPGLLAISSEPQAVLVLLANKAFIGVTPTKVELAQGKYQLLFRKDGYYDYEKQVDINSEDKVTVTAVLQQKKINF